ncbi:hypothetical protein D3C76_1490110 [compost metagenome]
MIRSISFKKKRIEISANTNALINPAIKNGKASRVKYCQFFSSDNALAPAITGTAIIKVKSDAARWLKPRSTPPEIVDPDREKPGQIDRH